MDEHGAVLYRTAFRLVGDRHEAEDIVQETYRSIWKSRFRYRSDLGERAWMISILRRRVADRWRRRRLPTVLAGETPPDVATTIEDPLQDQYTDEMQKALGALPPELRETLLLVVVSGLTHQEAANELGIPLGTVLSRVARARSRLRAALAASIRSE